MQNDYIQKFVDYHGYKINTYVFGNPKSNNVTFAFPSFPHSGRIFNNLLENYADIQNVKLISFDLPGWGGDSENVFSRNRFSFETVVSIADTILADYRIGKFNILGYSFGGALALMLAKNLPERVCRVALVSAIISGEQVARYRSVRLVKLASKLGAGIVVKRLFMWRFLQAKRMLMNEIVGTEVESILEQLQTYESSFSKANSKVLLDSLYSLFKIDLRDTLQSLSKQKFMIINSTEEGRMFMEASREIRSLLKGESSAYLKGTHSDFILRPEPQSVSSLFEFLEGRVS